jgi:UDPglucose 6-dehydrogenase
VVRLLRERLGTLHDRTIGLLGLAFKPDTDDLREAASVELAHLLLAEGALVRGYDPVANAKAREVLPEIELAADPYALAQDADALVLVTEWKEFRDMDRRRLRGLMRRPIFIDGRNLYKPEEMVELGFDYASIGRPVPNGTRASAAALEPVAGGEA